MTGEELMTGKEIRKRFIEFFEKREHKVIPSSSLVSDDPTVLLTSAGMQQFKPYFLGKESPWGNRVTSVQKTFRTSDIEAVGDETHLTFFEMLGNFSFHYPKGQGSYFKEEAIRLGLEFVRDVLQIDRRRISVSVFGGDSEVPIDTESIAIWKQLGFTDNEIKKGNREDNFWGPTGDEGPCGPTTEIIVDGVEIWNLVFNEYYSDVAKRLTTLSAQGVDTGMGLERVAQVVQGKRNVYETDLFAPMMTLLQTKPLSEDYRAVRIIADHMRASIFLITDGVIPSNKAQGYILRRLLRRSLVFARSLELRQWYEPIIDAVVREYGDRYTELKQQQNRIVNVVSEEADKFSKTIEKGMKEFERLAKDNKITGEDVFRLYETYGFPIELTVELASENTLEINRSEIEEARKKHQEASRKGVERKFGGHGLLSSTGQIVGGSDKEKKRILRMHTATHLLHQALRDVFGDTIKQMGSDITSERLRFDFSHNEKLTPEQIKRVESIVNEKITANLPVYRKEMAVNEAEKTGALAFFKDKYGGSVSVYFIGSDDPVKAYSKEFCAGPHVAHTDEIGSFKIMKEEAVGAGVRRIKATVA
jgi:alanyl-tRNA synthetase